MKHLRGKHDQKDHGRRQFGSVGGGIGGGGKGPSLDDVRDIITKHSEMVAKVAKDFLDGTSGSTLSMRGRLDNVREMMTTRREDMVRFRRRRRLALRRGDEKARLDAERDFAEAFGSYEGYRAEYNSALAAFQSQNRANLVADRQAQRTGQASFRIQPDGTIKYTPSRRAKSLAAVLSDPDRKFRRRLADVADRIESIADDVFDRERRITSATQVMATTNPDTEQHRIAKAKVEFETEKLERQQQKLDDAYNDLTTLQAEFLTALNPSPTGGNAPRPPTTFNTRQRLNAQNPSDEQRVRMETRIEVAYQIMETFIPLVSNNGRSTNLGFRDRHVNAEFGNDITRAYHTTNPSSRYRPYDQSEIGLNPSDSLGVVLHELFHGVEASNPVMNARIRAWYRTRTDPSKPETQLEQLSAKTRNSFYGPSEVTRPDAFADYYIGRDYQNNGASSEVLSMFGDYMTSLQRGNSGSNSTYFSREDPEWVMFCIDLLTDPESYE